MEGGVCGAASGTGRGDEWEEDFDYVTAASARPPMDLLLSNLGVLAQVCSPEGVCGNLAVRA